MMIKVHRYENESGYLTEKLSRVITVHEFTITEEDHVVYAAEPLHEWEHSDVGQWVIEHAVEQPVFHSQFEYASYSYKYIVRARLYEEDITFYQLKWGK
jgi:hypothetical protein